MTAPTVPTFDVDALRAAPEAVLAMIATLADDIEWTDLAGDAPKVFRGRPATVAMLEDVEAQGIVSTVLDGFVSGDRAALTVHCALPDGGGVIVTNALLNLRDGKVVRWFGTEAWTGA